MSFITKEGLKRLDNYKYKSGGYSKLDNKMNPFWEWVETKVPRTMAPNTVTLIGFVFMAASYGTMLFYDSTFTKDIPHWIYIFASVCQFIYQTLDAVDGKHARTTKCSSPLGQLFDHGCDSFSMCFLILTVCQMTRLGPSNELLFFSGLIQLGFFCANWGEYHSGVLTTSVTYFGVTEGELLILGCLFIAGVFGPGVWDLSIAQLLTSVGLHVDGSGSGELVGWLLTTGLKMLVLRFMYVVVTIILVYFFITTLMVAKDKALALSQFVPVIGLIISLRLWCNLPIFMTDPAVVLLSSALIFSLITCRLIISSLTEMRTPVYQKEVIVFLIFGVIMKFISPMFGSKTLDYLILYSLPVYVTGSVFMWSRGVIEQISSYLGIYCFSLQKRERRKLQ